MKVSLAGRLMAAGTLTALLFTASKAAHADWVFQEVIVDNGPYVSAPVQSVSGSASAFYASDNVKTSTRALGRVIDGLASSEAKASYVVSWYWDGGGTPTTSFSVQETAGVSGQSAASVQGGYAYSLASLGGDASYLGSREMPGAADGQFFIPDEPGPHSRTIGTDHMSGATAKLKITAHCISKARRWQVGDVLGSASSAADAGATYTGP